MYHSLNQCIKTFIKTLCLFYPMKVYLESKKVGILFSTLLAWFTLGHLFLFYLL